MNRNRDENQVMALAAIFQAALCADQLATGERCAPETMRALMEGILELDPDSPEAVLRAPGDYSQGLRLLRELFRNGQQREQMRPLSYGLGLMHLANRLRRASDVSAIVRHRLEALADQRAHFQDLGAAEFCRRAAGIYVDTLGSFNFRIRVQGDPDCLRNDDTAARIRALFLAGVRAAFLWRQAGGRRWHLLFQRKRLLAATEKLLESV